MEELIEKLKSEFADECAGVKEYFALADEYGEQDARIGKILSAIAVDEYTHARVIVEYLKEHDVVLTESDKTIWAEVVGVMQRHGHLENQ